MKKLDILLYFALGVIIMGIIIVVIFKFIFTPKESFVVRHLDKITVVDLDNNEINFSEFLSKNESTYVLIFSLNDCTGCIFKGIEDLKLLKNTGKPCLGLVINDYIEDVKAWASHYENLSLLILKRLDFFEHLECVSTPVFVKFVRGQLSSYRYITAN